MTTIYSTCPKTLRRTEFSMDDESADELTADDELELPDDLDIDSDEITDEDADEDMALSDDLGLPDEEDADEDNIAFEFDMEEDDSAVDDLDDAVQLGTPDDDDDALAATAIITPNYEDTEQFKATDIEANDDDDVSSLDLGMEDTSLKSGDEYVEETGELKIELDEVGADDIEAGELVINTGEDDSEDISIIDFGGDDFDEGGETNEVSAIDDDDFVLDDDDAEDVRTGTFAPGDFDEPTAATESLGDIDDMDDLMLPDDVDEVSTKLDLARAFIDMGDTEGARGSLEEVMSEGNAEQKTEAKSLLDQI